MAKHTPNTSEPSDPHTSKAEPKEHVDQQHYGKQGEHRKELDVHHITDPGHVQWGKEAKEMREDKKKEEKEKKEKK